MPTLKHTFCRICSPCCPLVAELGDYGKITALKPDRSHPVSRGFACNKGLSYLEIHDDPDRLDSPMYRTSGEREPGGTFEAIGWDKAFAEIGARLRDIRERHGADAIGVYAGNPISFNSKAFGAVYSLAAQLGTKRSFNAATQDLSNRFVAVEEVFGGWIFPIPDFYRTNYLLCVGTNPRISKWTMASVNRPIDVLSDIVARGGKVRYLNPRIIESASPKTGDVIQVKPDTDVYFLAAMLNEIERTGGFREDLIARYGKNVEGLRAFIARYTPERVAHVVGVEPNVIRTAACEFMSADGASTHNATGVNQGRQGTLVCWLLHMLAFVTGNLGREGGEYYAKGYCSIPAPLPPGVSHIVETEFGAMRPAFGALPATLMADFIELEENPVRALIVWSGNPLLSVSGEERLRRAFSKLELIVCVDIYRNTTAEYADYLLPAADWLEREDINSVGNGGQPVPYAQYTDAVVPPHAGRRDDWWILARLEQELGIASPLDRENHDPMAQSEAMLAHSGLSIAQLRDAPHHTILLPQSPRDRFLDEAVVTPDSKVDCCPESFAGAIARCDEIFRELSNEPQERLKLISLRTMYMHNGSLANAPSLKRGKGASNPLHVHPVDAAAHDLAEGDTVVVFNDHGRVTTPVTLDSSLRPGVVALSHGYGQVRSPGTRVANASPGVNANRLMPTGPGSFEPLSNMSHMTGVPVMLQKATGSFMDSDRQTAAITPLAGFESSREQCLER